MIYGNGIDIQEIRKIQKAQEKRESFAKRILTVNELAIFEKYKGNRKYEFLAGRFSAKEAFSKAYGTGIGKKVGFQDIEILNDNLGRPTVRLTGNAKKYMQKIAGNNFNIHLSLSDDYPFALAFVIIEK